VSRSGTTVYFNDKALRRGTGVQGNFFDIETGAEYWVSGAKKDGRDRHRLGSGQIAIEASAVSEYLELTGATELDRSRLNVVPDLPATDRARLHALENEPLEDGAVEQKDAADEAG
jgi:hypothetical protein